MRLINTKKPALRRQRRGMTLIEAALSLGVAAVVLVGLAQLLAGAAETTKARATADRLEEVKVAAQEYLKANFTTLQSTIPTGAALMVPVGRTVPGGAVPPDSLQAGGFLSSSYVDANPYGQNHAVLIRRVSGTNDRIEAIITTIDGQNIPDQQLGRVATFVGADGGFMMSTPLAGTTGRVTGTGGGWAATASEWAAGGAAPQPGHVMASVAFNEGALVGDYLYRRDIGIPEANRMRTHLSMGGNNVNNVTQINMGDDNSAGGSILLEDDKVTIGPNIEVPGYITAGDYIHSETDITAANDIAAGHDVSAVNNVTARANVRGLRFVDIDESNNETGYSVDPSASSNVNDLKVTTLDGSTRVYNGGTAPTSAAAVAALPRLYDRLPNYVAKAGYVARPNRQFVPKPSCGPGGQAKITLATIQDTMRFAGAADPVYASTPYGMLLGGLTLRENIYIGRKIFALDGTNLWEVRVSGTNPALNTSNQPIDWIILANTFCYYPDP